jgi:hypothetical protein
VARAGELRYNTAPTGWSARGPAPKPCVAATAQGRFVVSAYFLLVTKVLKTILNKRF